MKKGRDFEAREAVVFQRNEITDHYIYKNLAGRITGVRNRRIMAQIADDEMRHYSIWKSYTQKDVKPRLLKVWFYAFVSSVFGLLFGIKLMEKSEKKSHDHYSRIPGLYKEINGIIRDEEEHEQALLSLLDEDLMKTTASLVLGFNNALVEMVGIVAGLTFALRDTALVAITAFIAGLAAAFAMGASKYFQEKSEVPGKNPLRTAFSSGIAYIVIVVLLVFPYILFSNLFICFGITLFSALCITGFFSFYIAICRNRPFRSRFFEVIGLLVIVSLLSILAGYGIHFVYGMIG
ncbi:MAG: rubrerythrin family protein [Chlorobiaceae bacterium]|nr:rubrerythrin family protein [Chlorobiaceae bacterium]NTV61663.1 rubrerythrin family protein [Chlorobiaceae bacterium]